MTIAVMLTLLPLEDNIGALLNYAYAEHHHPSAIEVNLALPSRIISPMNGNSAPVALPLPPNVLIPCATGREVGESLNGG